MSHVHRFSSLLRVVSPAAVGVAAAVISSFVLAPKAGRPASAAAAATAGEARPLAALPTNAGVIPTEERASTVQASPPVAPSERAPEPPPAARPPPDAAEIEAERGRVIAEQRERIARLEAEPLDDAWSSGATETIRAEIARVAEDFEHAGKVERLSCRTSGCVATLEFASFAEAQAGYMRYLTNALGMRCAQSAALDVPEDATQPFQVDIAFTDCARR
ncbi:MAG TPA: hypothetical protein VL242_51070 [Sorangium sp.]|uniref:hypothetical protein n=1 Tax=Sorangium sp. So ce1153 TaxID=3133333 RepID=UPI002B62112C|nr:hypothetical protein [Sorangium sp.]